MNEDTDDEDVPLNFLRRAERRGGEEKEKERGKDAPCEVANHVKACSALRHASTVRAMPCATRSACIQVEASQRDALAVYSN